MPNHKIIQWEKKFHLTGSSNEVNLIVYHWELLVHLTWGANYTYTTLDWCNTSLASLFMFSTLWAWSAAIFPLILAYDSVNLSIFRVLSATETLSYSCWACMTLSDLCPPNVLTSDALCAGITKLLAAPLKPAMRLEELRCFFKKYFNDDSF